MAEVEPDEAVPETRVEFLAYVIEQLRAVGVRVHPSSRLMLMHRTLQRGYVPYEDDEFPVALEAMRDMYQLGLIVEQMEAHRDNPSFRNSVQRLLKDSALPQDGGQNTPGRDMQFELYLAAICLNAGLLPVNYAEPDVTCVLGGTKWGIAAKRLKSLSGLGEHVAKGAEQIRKASVPGIVALDLTMARNQNNRPIVSRLQSQWYVPITQAKNDQFFDEHHADIYRWVAGSGVRAVLVFEFTLRLRPDGQWGHDGMMCWMPTTHDDVEAERDLRGFQTGFLKGTSNVEGLTREE